MANLDIRPSDAGAARLDPLARTALWTASLRAREQRRDDRLFVEPLATVLGGAIGDEIMSHFEERVLEGAEDPALAIRTRFFDSEISRIIAADGIHQVVLVAAGMDTRAFRLGWPPEVRVFELDRPSLLEVKEHLLVAQDARAHCGRTAVGVDLLGAWPDSLIAAGFRPDRPTVWLVEGLLYFLTATQRDRLLQEIGAQSAAASWFLADYVSQSSMNSREMRSWLAEMADKGHPWLSASDDPVRLLADAGWAVDIIEYGAPAADFGRWRQSPSPDVPTTGGRYLIAGTTSRDR